MSAKTLYISHCPEGADAHYLPQLLKKHSKNIIHIARDDKRLAFLDAALRFFHPTMTVITIPAWDCLPYDRVSPSASVAAARAAGLSQLAELTKPAIILTTANGFLQRTAPKKLIGSHSFIAAKGQKIARETLLHKLMEMGYEQSPTANNAGEYAVRGSLIDVVIGEENTAYRLDFFGDEIDSIRLFDPLTQISKKPCESFMLLPSSELIITDESKSHFEEKFIQEFSATASDAPLYRAISEGRHYAGMEHWLPLFYDHTDTLLDYAENPILSLDYMSEEVMEERFETIADYYQARDSVKEEQGFYPLPPKACYLTKEQLLAIKESYILYHITGFAHENSIDLDYAQTPAFLTESQTRKQNNFALLQEYCAKDLTKKYAISCFSEGSLNRMASLLKEHEIPSQTLASWQQVGSVAKGHIGLVLLPLERGFSAPDFALISEQDLLGQRVRTSARKKQSADKLIEEAASLAEGELVVHQEYGIGQFEKLETLTIHGRQHDCLRILYHGGDKIYVPVENIDVLSRYGAEGDSSSLDKLGSTAWQARKAGLKKRIKMMAEALIRIAAERELKKAPKYIADAGMYEEFCRGFPYMETEDQLNCIYDVTKDLASGKPMDRLICGDVGFGKTEVALRAAFLVAIQTGTQVAVIAPTTLLARQHFKNFTARFKEFPITIKHLSRMVSSSEATKTKKACQAGEVDILIGTHALLASSMQFDNLSLVILDEEQLFGVKQKERLKELRENVHVMSLSATPIPRTLHMSVSGIKDLSLIATPPVDRLAIRSSVMPFDNIIMQNALKREFLRGGKSFIIVPRIADLDHMAHFLRKYVPDIRFAYAHGQLPPAELDQVMNDFYDGKYDILLATNIIGSGIDLPEANTIIIHKADMFGLAQLYQMRGRVGRGKIRAYAYFTTSPNKKLSPIAIKRLEVIQHLDTLGAGFSLASHDMDIRGCGNLLGEEQSGKIKEVGVELYQQMLKEAIEEFKDAATEAQHHDWTPSIHLGIPVLIPDDYVADLSLRMSLYRRIAALQTHDALEEMSIELIDRFGPLPGEVKNLLEINRIKQLCYQAQISRVDLGPKGIVVTFHNNQCLNPDALIEFVLKNPTKAKLKEDQRLVLFFNWSTEEDKIPLTQKAIEGVLAL